MLSQVLLHNYYKLLKGLTYNFSIKHSVKIVAVTQTILLFSDFSLVYCSVCFTGTISYFKQATNNIKKNNSFYIFTVINCLAICRINELLNFQSSQCIRLYSLSWKRSIFSTLPWLWHLNLLKNVLHIYFKTNKILLRIANVDNLGDQKLAGNLILSSEKYWPLSLPHNLFVNDIQHLSIIPVIYELLWACTNF